MDKLEVVYQDLKDCCYTCKNRVLREDKRFYTCLCDSELVFSNVESLFTKCSLYEEDK